MKAFAAAVLFLAVTGAVAQAAPDIYAAAVADTTRPKSNTDLDALRLPAATMAFAGVKPGMVIGELYPGGGYFTRMLSDVVGPKGKIYALETTRWKEAVELDQKMAAGRANVVVSGEAFGEFTLPEKVDLFWITQNYHDLHIKEYGNVDMAVFNKHVFDSLKPGGVYFILDHQANADVKTDADIAKVHRIQKAQLIAEVTAAGFKLAGEGDFLHRASDDHTKPIFDLHGMTDQYALKFVKP